MTYVVFTQLLNKFLENKEIIIILTNYRIFMNNYDLDENLVIINIHYYKIKC